jgi:tRNA-2-methylthio-N6-dimethylallyladenosine synthase
MDIVKYDYGYMFKYSERPNTAAAKKFTDNILEKTKQRRLTEIIAKQREHSLMHMKKRIGNSYEVLIEGKSKKSSQFYYGRTTHNATVVFKKQEKKVGDYVNVKIKDCTSATLIGEII